MDKLYLVTFTRNGKKFRMEVAADCQYDAIEMVKEDFTGEDFTARLIAVDNAYFGMVDILTDDV